MLMVSFRHARRPVFILRYTQIYMRIPTNVQTITSDFNFQVGTLLLIMIIVFSNAFKITFTVFYNGFT